MKRNQVSMSHVFSRVAGAVLLPKKMLRALPACCWQVVYPRRLSMLYMNNSKSSFRNINWPISC
jgi:hypothetical protein